MERIKNIKYQISKIKNVGFVLLVFVGLLSAAGIAQYPGLMPEVLVTASKYDNQEYMMPEVVVTATRPTEPIMEIAMATENPNVYNVYDDVVYNGPADYKEFKQQLFEISNEQDLFDPGFIFTKVKVRMERDAKKVSTLIIDEGDTLKDDLEFSGKSGQISGVLKGDLAIIGGDLDITETGKIVGDVVAMGGSIVNRGVIENDLAVFGGSFNNKGILEGDIFVAGGNVKLDSGSVVLGDIAIIGGSLEQDTNAIVKGEIKSVEIKGLSNAIPKIASALKMSRSFPKPLTFVARAVVIVPVMFGLFVIMLLVLLVFPKPSVKVAETTNKNVWIPIAIGFGMQLLIVPLIVLLAVSIVGIPVIPLFMLALFACLIVGLTSVFYLVGMRIKHTDDGKGSLIAKFAIGFIVIMAIPLLGAIIRIFSPIGGLFSVLGAIIIYVVATIGLGAAFYTLITRKKS